MENVTHFSFPAVGSLKEKRLAFMATPVENANKFHDEAEQAHKDLKEIKDGDTVVNRERQADVVKNAITRLEAAKTAAQDVIDSPTAYSKEIQDKVTLGMQKYEDVKVKFGDKLASIIKEKAIIDPGTEAQKANVAIEGMRAHKDLPASFYSNLVEAVKKVSPTLATLPAEADATFSAKTIEWVKIDGTTSGDHSIASFRDGIKGKQDAYNADKTDAKRNELSVEHRQYILSLKSALDVYAVNMPNPITDNAKKFWQGNVALVNEITKAEADYAKIKTVSATPSTTPTTTPAEVPMPEDYKTEGNAVIEAAKTSPKAVQDAITALNAKLKNPEDAKKVAKALVGKVTGFDNIFAVADEKKIVAIPNNTPAAVEAKEVSDLQKLIDAVMVFLQKIGLLPKGYLKGEKLSTAKIDDEITALKKLPETAEIKNKINALTAARPVVELASKMGVDVKVNDDGSLDFVGTDKATNAIANFLRGMKVDFDKKEGKVRIPKISPDVASQLLIALRQLVPVLQRTGGFGFQPIGPSNYGYGNFNGGFGNGTGNTNAQALYTGPDYGGAKQGASNSKA